MNLDSLKNLNNPGNINSIGQKLIMIFLFFYVVICGINIALGIANFNLGGIDTAIYQTSLWQAGHFMNPKFHFYIGSPETFTQLHFMPMGFVYGLLYRFFTPMIVTGFLYITVYTLSTLIIYKIVNLIFNNNLYSSLFAILHNL